MKQKLYTQQEKVSRFYYFFPLFWTIPYDRYISHTNSYNNAITQCYVDGNQRAWATCGFTFRTKLRRFCILSLSCCWQFCALSIVFILLPAFSKSCLVSNFCVELWHCLNLWYSQWSFFRCWMVHCYEKIRMEQIYSQARQSLKCT